MTTDRRRLLSAARRLLPTRADAEDAVQDAYVRALGNFPDATAAPPAWFYTVLRNIAIDRLRRGRLESGERDTALLAGESPQQWMEDGADCEAAIRHLLSRVSFTEAAAIVLREVFEFEYGEIAGMIDKTDAATRQLLHRARTRLHYPGHAADREDADIGVFRQALESRDPARLIKMLQSTTIRGQLSVPAAMSRDIGPSRSSTMLVQIDGRYALALVMDGVLLCIVPVGMHALLAGEPA